MAKDLRAWAQLQRLAGEKHAGVLAQGGEMQALLGVMGLSERMTANLSEAFCVFLKF